MHQKFIIFLGSILFTVSLYADCNSCSCAAQSKTFFTTRPQYQSAKTEMVAGLRTKQMLLRDSNWGGVFDVIPFGGTSTKSNHLASYFTPQCKTTLTVAEISSPLYTPDLLATHFNINTTDLNYTGTISLAAKQASAGVGLNYKQHFCWNDELTHGWWASISSPITWVENTVTLCEKSNSSDLNADPEASNAVTSMCAAFKQPDWSYGKINSGYAMNEIKLADIELKLGYEWLPCEESHVAIYAGILAPTGNKPCAHYVFEPIVGHGGHTSLMWGSEGGFCIWNNAKAKRSISLEYALHSQYVFKTTQKRSFDLINRPWSRYLAVYKDQAQAQQASDTEDAQLHTPGINIFTRDMYINPGFSNNLTTAFIFKSNSFQVEAGYNLFSRQAECANLKYPWPTGNDAPALKDATAVGNLNPFRTIEGNWYIENLPQEYSLPFNASNYSNHNITAQDLDLHSAEHPAILSHKLHGSVGYFWSKINHPSHLHAGASYEFSAKNTTLNRWTVWAKGGITF